MLGGAHYILRFYEFVCSSTGKLPGAELVFGQPEVWKIGCYYGCLILGAVIYERGEKTWEKFGKMMAEKGYLSQKIIDLCKEKKVISCILSLGGNVQTIGMKPDDTEYTVGITDPSDGSSIYGTVKVKDKAVITSGIYQRNFKKDGKLYHHIMDKRTGMPADNNLASVTVIAENGAMADAYATALSVMGEEKAIAFQKKHPQIQIILIRKDGTFYQSEKAGMIKS